MLDIQVYTSSYTMTTHAGQHSRLLLFYLDNEEPKDVHNAISKKECLTNISTKLFISIVIVKIYVVKSSCKYYWEQSA